MTNFNSIAPYYDFLARLVFGNSIMVSQLFFIPYIPMGATVLIVGGGSGHLLKEVLEKSNLDQVTYLEASSKMIELSQAKLNPNQLAKVNFICSNNFDIPGNASFDVIITPYVLDLFGEDELEKVVTKLAEYLRPEGLWFFVDFECNSNSSFRQFWQRPLLLLMFLFFRLTCNLKQYKLPFFSVIFCQLGFRTIASKTFFKGMIVSAIYKRIT
jgi:tRNA (cmo5U34)-methyltransferase